MQKNMKSILKKFAVIALVLGAALVPASAFATTATATGIQGEVLIQKAGSQDWAPVTADTALATGDSLKTREGSCALTYADQATFMVEKNTTLTVEERADANDIKLLLGKIKGKVNHEKVTNQPFVVTTPAAVATVRGTEVDFGFNDNGELTVDLHNGNIQVVNEGVEMTLDLGGKKSITIKYDKEANVIRIKNECGSDGPVKFNLLGTEYASDPCDEKEIDLSTAEQGTNIPGIDNNPDDPENPDEGREPMSEFNA
jgi:hypothetical protein